MTTEQTLPITEMLEEKIRYLNSYDFEDISGPEVFLASILPKVRTLEEELVTSLKKAKEEERERIVGILEEMKFCIQTINEAQKIPKEKEPYDYAIQILQEAITRITN